MPIQTLKQRGLPRIGMIVKVEGREGQVLNRAGNEIHVKFDDGTFGFYDVSQIENYDEILDHGGEMDSSLKGFVPSHPDIPTAEEPHRGTLGPTISLTSEMVSHSQPVTPSIQPSLKPIKKVCPFCKGTAYKIGMDFEQKETGAFQCMKCSQRFISEKQSERYNEFKDIMPNDETSIHITM